MDYAETVVPESEVARLTDEDRYCLVTLNRWAHEPIFTRGRRVGDPPHGEPRRPQPAISASPSAIKVDIPIPDETVRESSWASSTARASSCSTRGWAAPSSAALAAGLNLVNLNRLAAESCQEDREITLEYMREKKKEIIETEAVGLLEFLESEHDLSYVSGHDFVKRRFSSAAKAIRQGRLDVLPMGYLIAGPVGTGKSFMVAAFTGEIGMPMVKFRNFRSKWQGVTEQPREML